MVQPFKTSPLSSISSSSSTSSVFSEEGDAILALAFGNNMSGEDVIELSSGDDEVSEGGDTSVSESESEILENLQEIQKSFDSNLKRLDKRLKRRKSLKDLGSIKRERTEENYGVPNSQGTSNDNNQLEISSGTLRASSNREEEYKRKLELVTKQLEECRMELMRKQRMSKKSREPVCIEVADDLEFYSLKTDCMTPAHTYWIQRRVKEFFPQVLEIMCKNSVWNSVPGEAYLTAQDVLLCRQVSKSWKNSVDKFLINGTRQQTDERSLAICSKLCFDNNLQYESMVTRLTKDKMFKSQCPFPSKDLVVSHFLKIDDENSKSVTESVNRILKKYGGYLLSFTFCGLIDLNSNYSQESEIINCWNEVRRWIKKILYLRSLELSFPPCSVKVSKCDRFPALRFLETVKCSHVPRYLVDSMLRRNPQIRNLTVVPTPEEEDLSWGEYNELNHLQKLCLDVSKVNRVQNLRVGVWPLKKLVLSGGATTTREEPIHLKELFETLLFFQMTLTDLSLDFRVISASDMVLSLELPYLQNISLSLRDSSWGRDLSYDFLLPLKALRSLKIIMEGEVDTSHVDGDSSVIQVIQLKGYLNRLYESNLWKLFPNLEKVDVTAYYGREDVPKHFKYSRDRLEISQI